MALVNLVTMVLFLTPSVVEFSAWRAEFDWGQPISMRAWWMGTICLAVRKRAASSGSAAEEITNLMIWARVRSGTLFEWYGSVFI